MSGRASSSRKSTATNDPQATPRGRGAGRQSANRVGRESQDDRPQRPQVDLSPRRAASKAFEEAPTPARALSQPPPLNVLRRSLAAQTPATPRRAGGAANTVTPGSAAAGDRSMSMMTSAKRAPGSARKRRFSSFGGWGTGREQSPMELLRRVARAYQLPPTPNVQSRETPAGDQTSKSASRPSTRRSSGRDTGDGPSASRLSGSSSRRGTLRPGESIPGDITRDADLSLVDESSLSASELGRRAAGGTPRSGGIFDTLAAQRRGQRESMASALNQSGRSSLRDDFSMAETTGVSARERQLEEKLLDLGPDASLDQLDEMARRHLFGSVSRMSTGSGHLDTTGDGDTDDDDDDDDDVFGGFVDTSASRRSRALSEPAAPSADASLDFGGDQMPSFMEAVDTGGQVSDSMPRSRDYSLQKDSDESDEAAVDRGIQSASDISAQLRSDGASPDSRSRSLAGDATADLIGRGDDDRAGSSTSRSMEQDYSRSLEAQEAEESDDGEAVEEELEDEEEDVDADATLTPADRQTAQLAMLRRRSTKRRKSRLSAYTGNSVPPLPASFLSGLFSTFVTPASAMSSAAAFGAGAKNVKVEKAALEAVDDASHEFFATFSQKLAAQAARSGRNATITEGDVVAVMKAEGYVTPRQSVSSLARRFLPKEFSDLVTPLPKSQGATKPDQGKRKAGDSRRTKRDDVDASAAATGADTSGGVSGSGSKRRKN